MFGDIVVLTHKKIDSTSITEYELHCLHFTSKKAKVQRLTFLLSFLGKTLSRLPTNSNQNKTGKVMTFPMQTNV